MYGGAALFIHHIIKNKLIPKKITAAYVICPYIFNVASRIIGSKWIDV
jgi:hypothetical protein